MKSHEREMIVCLIEWVAEQLQIPVRVVMLIGKSRVWDFASRKRVPTFVHSGRLDARARKHAYTSEGLEQIRTSETEEDEQPLRKIG